MKASNLRGEEWVVSVANALAAAGADAAADALRDGERDKADLDRCATRAMEIYADERAWKLKVVSAEGPRDGVRGLDFAELAEGEAELLVLADPIEGTSLAVTGSPGACSVIAVLDCEVDALARHPLDDTDRILTIGSRVDPSRWATLEDMVADLGESTGEFSLGALHRRDIAEVLWAINGQRPQRGAVRVSGGYTETLTFGASNQWLLVGDSTVPLAVYCEATVSRSGGVEADIESLVWPWWAGYVCERHPEETTLEDRMRIFRRLFRNLTAEVPDPDPSYIGPIAHKSTIRSVAIVPITEDLPSYLRRMKL